MSYIVWLVGIVRQVICSVWINLDASVKFDLGETKRCFCRSCELEPNVQIMTIRIGNGCSTYLGPCQIQSRKSRGDELVCGLKLQLPEMLIELCTMPMEEPPVLDGRDLTLVASAPREGKLRKSRFRHLQLSRF